MLTRGRIFSQYDDSFLLSGYPSSMALFVGVVSHDSSRYLSEGSFRRLLETAAQLAKPSEPLVTQKDDFKAQDVHLVDVWLRPILVGASDFMVRRFRGNRIKTSAFFGIKEVWSATRVGLGRRAFHQVLRNRNITASHQQLWQSAISSGAEWCAVFEDDIQIDEPNLVSQIHSVIRALEASESSNSTAAIFLSESFSFSDHTVSHLQMDEIPAGEYRVFSSPEVSWTDTAGATLFSREFLRRIDQYFASLPRLVLFCLPVDMLLDLAFRHYRKRNIFLKSFHVIPGLCRQQSLRTTHPKSARE